ncbi:hypothetical protein ACFY1P_31355 [Streptomyces sp. NPDC001407]|uniref:hypothetical protein n=1 Tax=Streptomyces sp. NPDC001407 TaxID=3364573 RepID=UPI0036B3A056
MNNIKRVFSALALVGAVVTGGAVTAHADPGPSDDPISAVDIPKAEFDGGKILVNSVAGKAIDAVQAGEPPAVGIRQR